MPKSSQKIGEANFKTAVFQEYFGTRKFAFMQELDRIDFIITDNSDCHLIWAETKKDTAGIVEMFVQLILTIGKARTYDKYTPPPYLCVFDYKKIAFLPYNTINEILYKNDFNWNVTPSDQKTKEFKQIKKLIEETVEDKKLSFSFDEDKQILKEFIKNNFTANMALFPDLITYLQIDKNTFIPTYNRWLEIVKPSIAIDWDAAKKGGIIDGDFYLADLLSIDNVTLKDKLLIVLQNNHYKFAKGQDEYGISLFGEIQFKDNQKTYNEFWRKYKRPPLEIYWDYIIERRDLLVPQDIRERKGSFFTPQIWVQKSQEYLTQVFGENWQNEYYIWDCAAGTGNLLVGLTNKYNIWASTIDNQDIGVMKDRIKNGANLLESHVFQFDFLNDDFDKLPEELRGIINDPEKRKKLIIYINPPYAESSGGEKAKTGVSTLHKTRDKYQSLIGKATNEIFSQFLARIYHEIPECNLGFFSKLKYVNGSNFKSFRDFFKSSFKKGFICKGNTFDNVSGEFPICFSVWLLQAKKFPNKIKLDIFDNNGKKIGKKSFINGKPYINKWIASTNLPKENIGKLYFTSNDFQQNKLVYISLLDTTSHLTHKIIGKNNLLEIAVYFSVRVCIESSWLNDRDQFLYPDDDYKKDNTFKNNCLIFTLFHGQNRISAKDGINHWIPFSAPDVNAKDNFKSNFISNFLEGRKLSKEAKNVINAGKELWKYYHSKITGHRNAINDASFYDIREFFQGRSDSGTMKTKSTDETYNKHIKTLRQKMSILAEKIQPKVYEYGFLEE